MNTKKYNDKYKKKKTNNMQRKPNNKEQDFNKDKKFNNKERDFNKDKKSNNKERDFNKENLDFDTLAPIDAWLKDNNKYGKIAEISIIFNENQYCFLAEQFTLGIERTDKSSEGKNIRRALSRLFTINAPDLNLKNIENFLKNNKSELRIETLSYRPGETKYATSIYDQSGPCENIIKNTTACNIQTALENLEINLYKDMDKSF